ncbi:TIGR02466 family protein [Taklimakanibacter lacteus]|uniref:TIGR02466 family protein n=1 Tax=Taklimakanibacter lacteus TaxID=2268456 RepID=UPI000E66D68B
MPDHIESLFPTLIFRATLAGSGRLNHELEQAAFALAETDLAGRRWCAKHGYAGYTSYGSLADLPDRSPPFARLRRLIERHAARFAKDLHWDLRGGRPLCDSMWVNILPEGGSHSSHLHTNAVLSGTYYVKTPEGAGPIVFEDPRHAMMMAAPPRKASAPRPLRTYVSAEPAPGALILWESWLRHEVPLNRAEGERISVSFNLVIG